MAVSKKGNSSRVSLPEFSSPLAKSPDRDAFLRARETVLSEKVSWSGIGALSEKTLHKILKLYIEPNTDMHEVNHLGSVADIKNFEGVFEIQTRSYEKLLPKLRKMLPEGKVTVVCPLATDKSLCWIDEESGETSSPRRSNKKENIYDAFKMLFGIRDVINNESLSVRILFLEVMDFRSLNGYGKDKKHRSTRIERIPNDILCELTLNCADDYESFLPESIGNEFVASEFSKAIKRTSRYSFYILKLLVKAGAIIESGKKGRATLYRRTNPIL